MRQILKLIKKYGWRRYRKFSDYYRKKMKGNYTDVRYGFSEMHFSEDVGTTEYMTMKSGRRGVFKIFHVGSCGDWGSKDVRFDFVGYEGEKPIRECTLEEFMELYYSFFKLNK